MFTIFVYGTLKQGHGNHSVMPVESEFKGLGSYDGKMVSLGGFPGVIKDSTGITNGEVWEVPFIEGIDMLEGNGSFYTREEKAIEMEDGSVEQAWIYLLPEDEYGDLPLVEDGEW